MPDGKFENNVSDYVTSLLKGAGGLVPVVGSFIGEAIGIAIPNQRIDRLAKFAQELEQMLSDIPFEKLKPLLSDSEFISLLEEGFLQAARATTPERRAYIASIIANGLNDIEIKFFESKQLMKILGELNDVEIIWLRKYWCSLVYGDDEFRETHKDVINHIPLITGCSEDVRIKRALQDSYVSHLIRLDLLSSRQRMDSKTGLPKFNVNRDPEMTPPRITDLGKILLKHIDLVDTLLYEHSKLINHTSSRKVRK